jgi:hypothetical protein
MKFMLVQQVSQVRAIALLLSMNKVKNCRQIHIITAPYKAHAAIGM